METLFETSAGTVRGTVRDGVRAFLGVPYGASTAGPGRFAAPRPVEPWEGVHDARSHGPSSWQWSHAGMEQMLAMWGGGPEPSMGDNCLVLNVWAPAEVSGPLPVLVFLHGGGHSVGSGSWPAYDGHRLANRGDVVVVTLNHRLGVLGYLYLAEIGGPRFATSGINGILDIVEALRWIGANIATVGGDPGRVLVYGQSGGGAKVQTLLTMPSAAGLFQAAGIMSCPATRLRSPDEATAMASKLLDHLEIPAEDLDRLLELPGERLIEAHLAVGDPLSSFQPVLDGTWTVTQPAIAVEQGCAPDVPLLIGTTRDEHRTFSAVAGPAPSAELDDHWVVEQLRPMLGDDAEEVVAAYRSTRREIPAERLHTAIATDARFRIGSIRLAEARLRAGAGPVWMYRFDWETPVAQYAGTAPHGVDVSFFFDNVESAGVTQEGPGRARLAAQASSALVAFAANRSPQHDGLPEWPRYDRDRRATMLFDVDSGVVDDPDGDARRIFERLPDDVLARRGAL